MRVVIEATPEEVAAFAARMVADFVIDDPRAVLGLATGATPIGAYRALIDLYQKEGFTFKSVTTFNLDEYAGLSADHPSSYRTFMNQNLFNRIDIPLESTNIPDGACLDVHSECVRYEQSIRNHGGIDLQLLGIGSDGHIAFNEPGSSLASRTRLKTLAAETRRDNARFFKSIEDVPKMAITMGIASILDAKTIVLLACGENKAEAVAAMIEGPITADIPASALQMHEHVTVVLDVASSFRLKRKEYYMDCESSRRSIESGKNDRASNSSF